MELTAVCPMLLSVQLMVAGVGVVVDVLVQALRDSTAGVVTTRLTATDAPVPVPGVADSVPL